MTIPQYKLTDYHTSSNHFLEAVIDQEGFQFRAFIDSDEYYGGFTFLITINVPEHTDVEIFGNSVLEVIEKLNNYYIEMWPDIIHLIDNFFR